MSDRRPIADPPARLRQRRRADGSWRLWWEPGAAAASLGFKPADLDAARLTWSRREAERLNRLADRALEEARGGKRRAVGARTVEALAHRYLASPRFGRLKPATQRDYRETMRRLVRKWGASPVPFFTRGVIVEWYETLYREKGARMAEHEIRVFSVLFSYALDLEWIEANPCRDLRIESAPPRRRVAGWEELDALDAAALRLRLSSVGLACRLSMLMGPRQGDVLGALRGALRRTPAGWVWIFDTSKTDRPMALALHPELEAELPALAEAGPADAPLVICETTGRAWRADHFRHAFGRVRAEAAKRLPSVADLQFRDLRRSFGWWARAGGAAERDIGDGLGNTAGTDPRLSETYMPPSAEAAARAIRAVRRPGQDATGTED